MCYLRDFDYIERYTYSELKEYVDEECMDPFADPFNPSFKQWVFGHIKEGEIVEINEYQHEYHITNNL